MNLIKFLYHNLKGYRLLVMLAIIITFAQVSTGIFAVLPLKYIPNKISNVANDPACSAPLLNPLLDIFDTPQIDPALLNPVTRQVVLPARTKCPRALADRDTAIHPVFTHHSTAGVIVFSVLIFLLFGSLSTFLAYLNLFLITSITHNLTARLRNQLFDHLQRLSLDWHGKQKKGDLVQRVIGNIAAIEKFVSEGLSDLLSGCLTLLGIALAMLIISPGYALISLTIIPTFLISMLFYTHIIRSGASKTATVPGQLTNVVAEDINALSMVKPFTREDLEALHFAGNVNTQQLTRLKATRLQVLSEPLTTLLVIIGTAIILWVGGYVAAGKAIMFGPLMMAAGSVDIGTLILFLAFLRILYQPMRDLSRISGLVRNARLGVERIHEVLNQAPEIVETQMPYYGPHKLRGEISFENVAFSYSKETPPVLKGINLHIPAGRKVALVGVSGGGKTTLVKLIPRFYEIGPGNGTLRIDGVDASMYPLQVLRQNISMVLQDSVLFEGTIYENIAVGRAGANAAEIVDAAKRANIHTMIMQTLGGYQRVLREQGQDLSAGQRQRMAIAQAILRDAPILILDEPTASLDAESEAEVMHLLDQMIIGRTVITISHRLNTLGNVEEIIVLKDGRIAERGTFKDLKRQGGIFASLLEEQNRYNPEKAGEQSIIRSAFVQRPTDSEQVPTPGRPTSSEQPPIPLQEPLNYGLLATPIQPQPANVSYNPAGLAEKEQSPYRANKPAPHLPEATILVELDSKIIGQYRLNKQLLTIGRLSSNDIAIPNQRISRLHAKLYMEGKDWIIEDAESINGIVYKGQRVERVHLTHGDRVFIAPTVSLTYQAGSSTDNS